MTTVQDPDGPGQTPSVAGEGQEPTSAPQEGTPTTTGQEPAASTSTETERLQAELRATRAEAAKYRKAAKEAEEAARARQEAELSDLERATARAKQLEDQNTALTATLRTLALENTVTTHAQQLGIIDPAAAMALMNQQTVEWGDDGRPDPESVTAALRALVEAKPYLARKPPISTGAPANPDRGSGGAAESDADRRQRIYSGGGVSVLTDPAAAARAGGGVVLKQ